MTEELFAYIAPSITRIAPDIEWKPFSYVAYCPHDPCVHCNEKQRPFCGLCHDELDPDDRPIRCDNCRITYGDHPTADPYEDEEIVAVYTYPEDKACLARDHKTGIWVSPAGWCYLPEGHQGEHYYVREEDVIWPESPTHYIPAPSLPGTIIPTNGKLL